MLPILLERRATDREMVIDQEHGQCLAGRAMADDSLYHNADRIWPHAMPWW